MTTPVDAADQRAREVVREAFEKAEWLPHPSQYVIGALRTSLADAYRTIESLKRRLEKR